MSTSMFSNRLHVRDKDLLLEIKTFFKNAGNIFITNNNVINYQVRSINEITNIIIPHFDKYPLISQKYNDYIIFKNIVELVNKKVHLTKDGLEKIRKIKLRMNKNRYDQYNNVK